MSIVPGTVPVGNIVEVYAASPGGRYVVEVTVDCGNPTTTVSGPVPSDGMVLV
jgi:hypothetical protein